MRHLQSDCPWRIRPQPLHHHLAEGVDVGEFVAAVGGEEDDMVMAEGGGDIYTFLYF